MGVSCLAGPYHHMPSPPMGKSDDAFSSPGAGTAPLTPGKLASREHISRSFLDWLPYVLLQKLREASSHPPTIHPDEANKHIPLVSTIKTGNPMANPNGSQWATEDQWWSSLLRQWPERSSELFFRQERHNRMSNRIRNFMTWGSIIWAS